MQVPIGLTFYSALPGEAKQLLFPPEQIIQVMFHLPIAFSEFSIAASLINISIAIKVHTKPLTISPLETVGLSSQADNFHAVLDTLNQNMHM